MKSAFSRHSAVPSVIFCWNFLFEACFYEPYWLNSWRASRIWHYAGDRKLSVRVELSAQGALLSLAFRVITGTIFGFYPAYKASSLIPVAALNQE